MAKKIKKSNSLRKRVQRKTKLKIQKKGPTAGYFPIVGIGASAGGLEAYQDLFRLLPADTGMAFVLVQHLSPKHLSMMSAIVQKSTRMQVKEVVDGMTVRPNNVYVIPPNYVLEIFHGVLHLRAMTETHSTGHLVDTFFSSLARDRRNLAVGIILSGTGSDGSQGLQEIKAEGGISLVQDPKTAKYDGMPRMAIATENPDFILPVKGLVAELIRIASSPSVPRILATDETKLNPDGERQLQKIFMAVRSVTGTDFSVYKHPTMVRRIKRRMVLNSIDGFQYYHAFLLSSKAEVKALFKDLIINVTQFFRDAEVFEDLKTTVFPEIFKDRPEGSTIRIWVPGCSTGEEVYSIAICLLEYMGNSVAKFPIQIYGTDLSDLIIKKARAGLFASTIEKQVSEERLKRFFVKEHDGYRIGRAVRDCCIFSVQDITSDPPIHRLDLLSCRNLMIYLSSAVQKKLMETFYYALNPTGFLLLGSSESVGTAASLFSIANEKSKIYLKRAGIAPQRRYHFKEAAANEEPEARVQGPEQTHGSDPVVIAESVVLEKYAPAWILVNEAMDIVHFKGNTENLIAPRSGQPSWNLIKMLREDLVADVRVLLHLVKKEGKPARKKDIMLRLGHEVHLVDIEATALNTKESQTHYLVLFFERTESLKAQKQLNKTKDPEVIKLSQELATTQNSLRSFLDDQNATNEELQSANEEVLSANEELQSTNEELETAKEELQSTNEELITVNEELSNKNSELELVNDDLTNVLNNAQIAIVIVNATRQIRRLTPAAGKLLNITMADLSRKLLDFNLGFGMELLEEKLNEVIDNISTVEYEAQDRTGRYHSIRMRPYKTTDNRVDGAVLTFVDIDDIKNKEHIARTTHKYSNAIIQTIHDPLVVLDRSLRIEKVNEAFYQTFKVDPQETLGKVLYELGNGQWNIPELKDLLENLLPSQSEIRDFKVTHNFESIGQKTMLINAQRLEWAQQKEILILLAIRDVTPRVYEKK